MLALPYKGRLHESGYARFQLNMPVGWYDTLTAKFNKEGVVCSIEKNGNKAILRASYEVISQIKKAMVEAFRPVFETPMYLNQKNA
jgi:hypothetical protein